MRVFGIAGHSGMGKTTLLEHLIPELQACDLVLIECFKQGDFPKLEVWRAAL